ncbi:MAG: hypothetical protein HUJ63_10555, partial [Enterococcus sp.]|nr:hypothetical protein [Enterococcus sp.]
MGRNAKTQKTKKVTKVTDIDPLNKIMVHIYPKRTESEVYLSQSFDITKLLKFIESKRQANPETKMTLFHCMVAIMLRILKERPVMNRYITGGALFQRNFISAAFVSKQKLEGNTKEQLMLLTAKDDMTIDSISKTIVGDIKAVQDKESSNEGFNDIVKFLSRFPRLLLIFMSKILRWLDYWGHAPRSLKDGDPNFSSVLITNLGSIID